MSSEKSNFVPADKISAPKDLTTQSSPTFGTSKVAKPPHVQALERHLDLTPFLDQLEKVFSQPVRIQNGTPFNSESSATSPAIGGIKKLWADDVARKKDMAEFYNFKAVGKRKWLKNLLLEDSGSESDEQITDMDIKILLKIHKYRRKYQKRYHTDIMNSQSTYYAAGLFSQYDYHPEHQAYIAEQYGFFATPEFKASLIATPNATHASPRKHQTSPSTSSTWQCKNSAPSSSLPPGSGGTHKRKSCGSLTAPMLQQQGGSSNQSKRRDSAPKSTENLHSSTFSNPPYLTAASEFIARPHQHSGAIADSAPSAENFYVVLTSKKSKSSSKNVPGLNATSPTVNYPFLMEKQRRDTSMRPFSTNVGSSSAANQHRSSLVFSGSGSGRAVCNVGMGVGSGSLVGFMQSASALCQQSPPSTLDPRFRSVWKTIVNEAVPKALDERYIAKMYRTVALKNMAADCVTFLEQAKNSQSPTKTKNRQKRKNELVGLRPVSLPSTKISASSSTPVFQTSQPHPL